MPLALLIAAGPHNPRIVCAKFPRAVVARIPAKCSVLRGGFAHSLTIRLLLRSTSGAHALGKPRRDVVSMLLTVVVNNKTQHKDGKRCIHHVNTN